jgi:phosphate acyltransferase
VTIARGARVIVDTYSAAGPNPAIEGAAKLSLLRRTHVLLAGHEATIRARLDAVSYDPMYLQVVDCAVPYGRQTGDDLAVREAVREALPKMLALLLAGEADAFVSASPPAEVLHLCEEYLPVIAPGLPVAEAAVFPTMPRRGTDDPFALLVDVSGRRTSGASHLLAHAMMGAAYARVVTGVSEPHVGLLSTSLAPERGPADIVAAHHQLRSARGFRFAGNIRATDLPRGLADVVVTDGFSGHAVRGLLDAIADITVDAARYAWKTKVKWRVAMQLLRKGVGMLKKVSEFQQYGGAPVLGFRYPVILADPTSTPAALGNAIKLASKCVRGELVAEIERAVHANSDWLPAQDEQ